VLTDQEKRAIRECLDALRAGIPGFRSRSPQLKMIAVVAQTLASCRQDPGRGAARMLEDEAEARGTRAHMGSGEQWNSEPT
jgi:hypothetical protein